MPLGVAVIGCGFQGRIHASNVVASRDTELLLCADLDEPRATDLAADTGSTATNRLEDVWDSPHIDLVVIATTTHTHHDLALAGARSGKHILLEKPMAMTVEECLDIERVAEKCGVVVSVGYKFRYTAASVAARRAVPEPRVLHAHTLYDPAPPGASSWVNDPALSGGRLVSSLVHSVDLLRFLSGSEVVRVFAEGQASGASGTSGDPDTATATLLFANGAVGSLIHGTAGASALVSTWSFQTAASGVNATIHDHGRRLVLHRPGEVDEVVIDPTDDPFAAGTAPLLAATVARIAGEDVTVPGPRDGTISLLVSRCIEESIASGQPVEIPEL